ncbi:MAG: hypothetical protein RMI94_05430 [Bryobacterales bacterium]|nr:hypothetical protein [Bryobacteraceae bacterium]MDW8129971.1 hypothetical protein [Bryobacterales bacterium]
MELNLDTLKEEIVEYLKGEGFTIYYGFTRMMDELPVVYWNVDERPDFREFLAAARELGVKVIVYMARAFDSGMVDRALQMLDDCDFSRDERRSYERRLKEFRPYDGFTCAIELSFDYAARVYMYAIEADWYNDFLQLSDEIEAAAQEGDEEDEDKDSMGGYFSRN